MNPLNSLGNSKADLISELKSNGIKHTPEDILWIGRSANGKLVWLEIGNDKAGLKHIQAKAPNFVKRGIAESDLQELIIAVVSKGQLLGTQGRSRYIFMLDFKGVREYVSVEISENGFIVGANPTNQRDIYRLTRGKNGNN